MKKIKSVALCVDGNRRWAVENKKNKLEGHSYGVKNILNAID
jgi:undecaprenyl diphosphate synthase